LFVHSPQFWIIGIVGEGARDARLRCERLKANFVLAIKVPILNKIKIKTQKF